MSKQYLAGQHERAVSIGRCMRPPRRSAQWSVWVCGVFAGWVLQGQVDAAERPGEMIAEQQRTCDLERGGPGCGEGRCVTSR